MDDVRPTGPGDGGADLPAGAPRPIRRPRVHRTAQSCASWRRETSWSRGRRCAVLSEETVGVTLAEFSDHGLPRCHAAIHTARGPDVLQRHRRKTAWLTNATRHAHAVRATSPRARRLSGGARALPFEEPTSRAAHARGYVVRLGRAGPTCPGVAPPQQGPASATSAETMSSSLVLRALPAVRPSLRGADDVRRLLRAAAARAGRRLQDWSPRSGRSQPARGSGPLSAGLRPGHAPPTAGVAPGAVNPRPGRAAGRLDQSRTPSRLLEGAPRSERVSHAEWYWTAKIALCVASASFSRPAVKALPSAAENPRPAEQTSREATSRKQLGWRGCRRRSCAAVDVRILAYFSNIRTARRRSRTAAAPNLVRPCPSGGRQRILPKTRTPPACSSRTPRSRPRPAASRDRSARAEVQLTWHGDLPAESHAVTWRSPLSKCDGSHMCSSRTASRGLPRGTALAVSSRRRRCARDRLRRARCSSRNASDSSMSSSTMAIRFPLALRIAL